MMLVAPYVTHRDPALWENPSVFDPERFSPERSASRHRFAHVPFGGGPRYCIGNHLAMLELPIMVAMIAQRYRFRTVPGQSTEFLPSIVLRPRHGMKMTLSPARMGADS